MAKKLQSELLFSDVIYPNPDDSNSTAAKRKSKPAKAKASLRARQLVPESKQPFLPGLSRRGRPRSQNPISASERANVSRQRRLNEGVKRIELLLEPSVAADLDALTENFSLPRVEIISRLINKAAKQLRLKAQKENE